MTSQEIQKMADREMKKYELAKQIRDLLDAAEKEYGSQAWADDDMEAEICQLVFEE